MKNLKIGKRLVLAFVIVALVASIAGIVGLVVSNSTDKKYSIALVENGFSQGDIGRFNTYLNKGGAVVRDIIFLTDKTDLEAAQTELEDLATKAEEALAALTVNCQTPKELEQIAVIETNFPKYLEVSDKVTALGLQNKNEEALALFHSEGSPLLNTCMSAADALVELNVTIGNEVSSNLSAQSRISSLIIFGTIIAALAASVLFGIIISRNISRPVKEIEAAATKLAEGDLDVEVSYQSKDELGNLANKIRNLVEILKTIIRDEDYLLSQMAAGNFDINTQNEQVYVGSFHSLLQSMRKININLSNTLSQINQASDEVAAGSDQVSSGAQALSQGATEQASSVEELAATITDISEQVKTNAQGAQQGRQLAEAAGAKTEEGNHQMQEMISAMTEISEKSGQIGKIVKTIEDIAFQTNILALNAAVEAARAGAAGKGFAVVADEVRNLASKSAEASKSTAALIEGSIQAVERGTQLADETAQTLVEVVEGARQVVSVVDNISQACNEQALSIAQVTQGIDQISSVVQTNSATAEESAAASEELSGQSQMLKDLISQFKLKNTNVDSASHQRLETPVLDVSVKLPPAAGEKY